MRSAGLRLSCVQPNLLHADFVDPAPWTGQRYCISFESPSQENGYSVLFSG